MDEVNVLNNQESFLNFFKSYILMLDKEFDYFDNKSVAQKKEYFLKLKNLVMFLSYLRGDDGVFAFIPRSENIDYYYRIENIYLKRLQDLERIIS